MGSTVAGGASDLDLDVCYRLQGATTEPVSVGPGGVWGLSVSQNTRPLWALSGRFQNLPAGTYNFGLCGDHDSGTTNWNSLEYSYTTAIRAQL
jgi:hypothetical protein